MSDVCFYLAPIVEVLSYLHAKRIVHKYIKLGIMILSVDLSGVHLCDFELYASVDYESHHHKYFDCQT